MFEVGKLYRFTLWRDDRPAGRSAIEETRPYEIREVNLPLIKVWDHAVGITIINTASISFVSAIEHDNEAN